MVFEESQPAVHSTAEFDERLRQVRRAARSGAKLVDDAPALVDFAVEQAVDRFASAVASGKPIARLTAWAFAVGRNSARSGLRRHRATNSPPLGWWHGTSSGDENGLAPATREQLAHWLHENRGTVTAWQQRVLELLANGVSYHAAARKLGKDRSNIRRTFQRALRRLQSAD